MDVLSPEQRMALAAALMHARTTPAGKYLHDKDYRKEHTLKALDAASDWGKENVPKAWNETVGVTSNALHGVIPGGLDNAIAAPVGLTGGAVEAGKAFAQPGYQHHSQALSAAGDAFKEGYAQAANPVRDEVRNSVLNAGGFQDNRPREAAALQGAGAGATTAMGVGAGVQATKSLSQRIDDVVAMVKGRKGGNTLRLGPQRPPGEIRSGPPNPQVVVDDAVTAEGVLSAFSPDELAKAAHKFGYRDINAMREALRMGKLDPFDLGTAVGRSGGLKSGAEVMMGPRTTQALGQAGGQAVKATQKAGTAIGQRTSNLARQAEQRLDDEFFYRQGSTREALRQGIDQTSDALNAPVGAVAAAGTARAVHDAQQIDNTPEQINALYRNYTLDEILDAMGESYDPSVPAGEGPLNKLNDQLYDNEISVKDIERRIKQRQQ